MALASGTRLGPYEVVALLGAGGMGEVYRAKDSKLKREVALKVLPADVAGDQDRLARFQREAEVLASLNHPHIAHIFGLEPFGDTSALAMELVEGEDLAQRIARGAIPPDEALPIARQIAEALEAAHDAGIVHRDLKPANIKVREDGTVKVLDFGLAKALAAGSRESGVGSPPDLADSPTITSPAMTMRGVILGTAAYMSPEQAKGRAVDRRADIWAFGCVLYEMLAGRKAFAGEDITDTLTAVMRDVPDWTALPEATPASVRTLLRRCLEKDPHKRAPHISIARLAIEDGSLPESAPIAAGRVDRGRLSRSYTLVWSALAAVVAAAVAGAVGYRMARPLPGAPAPLYRSTLLIPENLNPRAPSQRFAISPDGRYLAYAGTAANESRVRLWLRPLNGTEAVALPGTDDAAGPFWSPDSRSVGFFAGQELRRVAVSGGPPATICRIPTATAMAGTWNADDQIVFANGATLARVSARGGSPESITTLADGETNHEFPWFLPDGRHIVYAAYNSFEGAGTFVAPLDGGPRQQLSKDSSNAQFAAGFLLFQRETTLFAQPFDVERRTFTGDAVPIVETVLPNLTIRSNAAAFSVSQAGALVYQTALGLVGGGARLAWFTRSGQQSVIVEQPAAYRDLSLTPDGRSASILPMDQRGRSDVWLLDLARGVRTRITFNGSAASAVWSPDGRTALFAAASGGNLDIFRKDLDAGGDTPVLERPGGQMPISWSPDGRVVLYDHNLGGSGDLWLLPLDGSGAPLPLVATPFSERWGQFSPDGRWIAYNSDESGRREVYVMRYGGAKGRLQVSTGGGSYPRWSRDGRELFFHSLDNKIVAARILRSADQIEVGALTPLFEARAPEGFARFFYDVAPDGRFLIAVPSTTTTVAQVNLVLNWPQLTAAR